MTEMYSRYFFAARTQFCQLESNQNNLLVSFMIVVYFMYNCVVRRMVSSLCNEVVSLYKWVIEMLNIHCVFLCNRNNILLNLYGCISRKTIFRVFNLVRMALYQVPCKTMVTLNLSSDYELDNNTMFQMAHGTN